MGRYPLLEVAKVYTQRRSGFIAESTRTEMERKFRYLNRVFVELKEEGKVMHTNPMKLDRSDIGGFVQWTKEQNLCGISAEKLLRLLKQLCAFVGNPVFERMRAEGEELPKRSSSGINALTEEEVRTIMQAAEGMKGWQGEVARFITAIYPFTGARPSELRLAQIEDIDVHRWTLFIRHPKGQGKYGRQRTEPILPPAREAVLRFLRARDNRLKGLGISEAIPLIPANHQGVAGYYSASSLRELKKKVQRRLPADFPGFSLKTFRASFCQMNIDRDPSLISDVSYAMGHSSTRTTEAFYGRVKQDKALERIQRAWQQASAKNPKIDEKYEVTGYA